MQLWGIPGAYYVSLGSIIVASVIVFRVPDLEVTEERKQATAEVTTWGIIKEYKRLFLTLGTGVSFSRQSARLDKSSSRSGAAISGCPRPPLAHLWHRWGHRRSRRSTRRARSWTSMAAVRWRCPQF